MSTENLPYPRKEVGLAPNLNSGFYGQDILSVSQFTREILDHIFGVAEEMRAIARRAGATDLLKGTVLACLFSAKKDKSYSLFECMAGKYSCKLQYCGASTGIVIGSRLVTTDIVMGSIAFQFTITCTPYRLLD